MRAVARTVALRDRLIRCPDDCGGPGLDLSGASPEILKRRIANGCDADIPEGASCNIAIRCPRCDGRAAAGVECDLCAGTDTPGSYHVRRCASSMMTPDLSDCLRANPYVESGILPAAGGLGDQALSFIEFRTYFDREYQEAREDLEKE